MPAGEASRQQKTKAVVDFRPKLRDYQNGEGGHQAVLNHLSHHLIGQVGAHPRHLAGGAALPHGKTVDTHRSKDNHNKHGGIGPNRAGYRQKLRQQIAHRQAHKAGQHTGRDKKALYKFDLCANQLAQQDKDGSNREIQ